MPQVDDPITDSDFQTPKLDLGEMHPENEIKLWGKKRNARGENIRRQGKGVRDGEILNLLQGLNGCRIILLCDYIFIVS